MKSTDVPLLTKKKSSSQLEECCGWFGVAILFLIMLSFIAGVAALIVQVFLSAIDDRDPRVVLESISISLQDDHDFPNGTTAKWDVGISIKNRNPMSYLQFGEFSVWVNCMSESSSQAVIPAFKLGVGERFLLNGSAESSLTDHARSQLVHGSVVDVLLEATREHRYFGKRMVKFACRDIGVGVLSNATRERKYCFEERGDFVIYVSPGVYVRPAKRGVSTLAVATKHLESHHKINN